MELGGQSGPNEHRYEDSSDYARVLEPLSVRQTDPTHPSSADSASGPSAPHQGRQRTRSFLGLGFGLTSAPSNDPEGSGGSARRKISFGSHGPLLAASGAANPSDQQSTFPRPPCVITLCTGHKRRTLCQGGCAHARAHCLELTRQPLGPRSPLTSWTLIVTI